MAGRNRVETSAEAARDTQRARVLMWMIREVDFQPDEFLTPDGVDCTALGEAAADHFGLYAPDASATIPDWVWDAAFAVHQDWCDQEAGDLVWRLRCGA